VRTDALTLRTLPAALAALALVAGARALPGHAAGVPLLPDLDQEVPRDLVLTRAGAEWRLGFRAAVRNAGAGPLVISAHRPDRGPDTMTADQVVAQRGAPMDLVRGVGRLRYVVSPDHRHWHLLGFERYELRRPGSDRVLVRDRKTGFCLGDRYGSGAEPPRYTSRCGLGEPARLSVTEGISPGYGDAYTANLEGQYLPLTGLRAGRYLLVHRVNADRRLRERRYDNDAASVLLRLRWSRGTPRLTVLASCPDSPTCAA